MTRSAHSLAILLAQLNAYAPYRSKVSDGGIGDQAHSARTSDHNPDTRGVYHARDFTDDPRGGLDALKLREALRLSRDPRIKYVISEGEMFSSYAKGGTPAWTWRPYNGPNRHFKHVHVSVWSRNGDDTRPWVLHGVTARAKLTDPGTWKTLRRGDKGPSVVVLQTRLRTRWKSKLKITGRFDNSTVTVVKNVQRLTGLEEDGVVGPRTWRALWDWKADR